MADYTYLLVPKEWLTQISQQQTEILNAVKGRSHESPALGEYVTEAEAKKIVKRNTTWFWQMRSKKKLPFLKLGRTNYYKTSDLLKLLEVPTDVIG